MCDKSSWGAFWKLIGDGTFDLQTFYKYSKSVPRDKSLIQSHCETLSKTSADIDEVYNYLILQCASFGGKQIYNIDGVWKNTSFRSYWQPTPTSKRRSPVNPMQPMVDVLEDRVGNLVEICKGITCYHSDIYKMIDVIEHDPTDKIIYIDPPYTNTTGYGFGFDCSDFLSNLFDVTLSPIFVSEKESLSEEAIQLNFSSNKGGISGNKKSNNQEWLNVFR